MRRDIIYKYDCKSKLVPKQYVSVLLYQRCERPFKMAKVHEIYLYKNFKLGYKKTKQVR